MVGNITPRRCDRMCGGFVNEALTVQAGNTVVAAKLLVRALRGASDA
jgi:hypothetical protein